MQDFSWYDGKIFPYGEVRIPLCDRSYFFGDAIYEAAIGTNGRIYRLDDHLDRFFDGCSFLSLTPPNRDELKALLLSLAQQCKDGVFFLYFQYGRHGEERNHIPTSSDGHLLINFRSIEPPHRKNLSLISYPDRRYLYCHIKTVNLLPAVLASSAASRAGADEAVLHRGNFVTECAHSNVSVLKNGTLITHPADCRILPGIMRARLLSHCRKEGIPVTERAISTEELLTADEILVTSSSRLIARAEKLDGRSVGMKSPALARLLVDRLFSEFERETK